MDRDNNYIDRLTDSAKEELNLTTQEITNKIVEQAIEIARRRDTAEKEISLRDIIEAKEEVLNYRRHSEKAVMKRKRMSWLISITGVTYALAGIIIYLYQNNEFDIKNDLGLIIAAIGILVTLLAFFYTQLVYRRKTMEASFEKIDGSFKSEIISDYEIVDRWKTIERLGSELMRKKGFPESRTRSINYIIQFLSENVDNESTKSEIRVLLKARNQILHESLHLSKNEKRDLLEKSNRIIEMIEEKLKKH